MRSWYKRLLPSPLLLVIYSMSALTLLAIVTYKNVVNQLVEPHIQTTIQQGISERFRDLIETIFSNSNLMATVVSFIFWLVVAALIYVIFWAITVFIKDILNEIEISLVFVHPRSFSESKHWIGFAVHYLLRVAVLLLLVGYGVVCIYILWPAMAIQFSYAILDLTLLSVFYQILPTFILAVLSLHGFVLLVQLFLWKRSADYWKTYQHSM